MVRLLHGSPFGNKLCGPFVFVLSKLVRKIWHAMHFYFSKKKQTSKLTRSVERKSSCGHLSETARRFHHRSGPCGIPPWNPVCWGCCGSSWRPSWPLVSSPDSPQGQTQPLTPPLPCCMPRSGPSVLSTVAYFSPLLVCESAALGEDKQTSSCLYRRWSGCVPVPLHVLS